jgi:hypothetical protein
MRYVKPSIVALGAASCNIQGHAIKTQHNMTDADGVQLPRSTGSAYDLDE